MAKELPFTPDELDMVRWMVGPPMNASLEDARKVIYRGRTMLYLDLQGRDTEFVTEGGDYGEGGWVSYNVVDLDALQTYIEDRERSMLDGMTLEEFAGE